MLASQDYSALFNSILLFYTLGFAVGVRGLLDNGLGTRVVGDRVGLAVDLVGARVGLAVDLVGARVGFNVGINVGRAVGLTVSNLVSRYAPVTATWPLQLSAP